MVVQLATRQNRSDRILSEKDFVGETNFDAFEYRHIFKFLCEIVPNRRRERLDLDKENPGLIGKEGLLYALVLNGKLIKLGSTTTGFKKRIQSYNCGRRAYRRNGTCSVTNYFVLQTFLRINKRVQVYAYFPKNITFKVFGEKETIALPAKRFENKLLTYLKKQGKLPIMCTQQ